MTKQFCANLTVVEPEPHVLLFNAEPLGQVQVDVLNGGHAAKAARVGQHPLQRGVGGRHVTCSKTEDQIKLLLYSLQFVISPCVYMSLMGY